VNQVRPRLSELRKTGIPANLRKTARNGFSQCISPRLSGNLAVQLNMSTDRLVQQAERNSEMQELYYLLVHKTTQEVPIANSTLSPLAHSFTREPPHFTMINKMLIASHFYDKFIKLTTFLGDVQYCIHDFDNIGNNTGYLVISSSLPSFLATNASRCMTQWILSTSGATCSMSATTSFRFQASPLLRPWAQFCISTTSHRAPKSHLPVFQRYWLQWWLCQ